MKHTKAVDMDGRNWVTLQGECLYNKEKKLKLKYTCTMDGVDKGKFKCGGG